MMEKDEKMKMLFEEHHRHLSEIRGKVQTQSQRTIWILALATGWIISAKNPMSESLRYVLSGTFLLIGISTMLMLFKYDKNYRTEAKVISKINDFFGFFEEGSVGEKKSIYPESWKRFGEGPSWRGLVHYVLVIIVMTVLSITAVFIR